MQETFLTAQQLDPRLEAFTLAEHGDRHERRLWPEVGDEFPLYEKVWRRYIVPLTHRLETDLPPVRQIRFRREMKDFELFAMSHYSVFLNFGRATRRLRSNEDEDSLANDVFYLLDSSLDNLKRFFEQLSVIGKLIDVPFAFKEPKKDKQCPELEEIADYRDTLLHNPLLGRAVGQGVELIPVHSELEKAKASWLYCESLPAEKFVETRALLERYRSRYALYLNARWGQILALLDSRREKFVRRVRLDPAVLRDGVKQDRFIPSTFNPVGASGQFVIDVVGRSDTLPSIQAFWNDKKQG